MLRNGLIDEAEKLEPFLVAVPLLAQTEDLAVSGIQGGEQRRGAIALVIMRHGWATSGFERQAGLGTIKGLDLTLLIQAKHHGMLRRIQIQTERRAGNRQARSALRARSAAAANRLLRQRRFASSARARLRESRK